MNCSFDRFQWDCQDFSQFTFCNAKRRSEALVCDNLIVSESLRFEDSFVLWFGQLVMWEVAVKARLLLSCTSMLTVVMRSLFTKPERIAFFGPGCSLTSSSNAQVHLFKMPFLSNQVYLSLKDKISVLLISRVCNLFTISIFTNFKSF